MKLASAFEISRLEMTPEQRGRSPDIAEQLAAAEAAHRTATELAASATTPGELSAAETAIARASAQEIAALAAHRKRLNEIEHPLHVMLQDRRLAIESIPFAELRRERYVALAASFAARLALCPIGTDSVDDGMRFHFENYPMEANATRCISACDAWLAVRRADIAALDAKILGFAVENKLERLLPADLRPKDS